MAEFVNQPAANQEGLNPGQQYDAVVQLAGGSAIGGTEGSAPVFNGYVYDGGHPVIPDGLLH